LFLCAAVVGEIFMMRAGKTPRVDHVSHLGGYAAGIVSGLIWRYSDRLKDSRGSEKVMERIGEKGDEKK
jgi:membrane associated rhomboid family serine protease